MNVEWFSRAVGDLSTSRVTEERRGEEMWGWCEEAGKKLGWRIAVAW